MISNFNVPNPCSKSWSGMKPAENGRYCDSCQKVVLDLTHKTNEEILAIIAANAGKKLCGTFRTTQLLLPPRAKTNNRTVRFLAAVLLAFGMTLFSCSNDAPKTPSATKTLPDTTTLSPKAPNANDPFFLEPEPGKQNEKQSGKQNENENESGKQNENERGKSWKQSENENEKEGKEYPVPDIIDEGGPYSTTTGTIEVIPGEGGNDVVPVAEEPVALIDPAMPMPEFTGGETAMWQYLKKQLRLPPGDAEGTVFVGFTVKADGSIDNVKLLRGVSPELDAEALRAVRGMPKWKPAVSNGKAVDCQMNLPVRFRRQ